LLVNTIRNGSAQRKRKGREGGRRPFPQRLLPDHKKREEVNQSRPNAISCLFLRRKEKNQKQSGYIKHDKKKGKAHRFVHRVSNSPPEEGNRKRFLLSEGRKREEVQIIPLRQESLGKTFWAGRTTGKLKYIWRRGREKSLDWTGIPLKKDR